METVLITGASGGIGYEFAKIFAHKGYNLVLVARNRSSMERIADNITKDYDISISVISFDLAKISSASDLYNEISKRKIQIDILINNAGVGDYGQFVDSSLDKSIEMINLNITTLTELTLLYVKEMKKRNSGRILNVASTAAFQPVPKFAVYGGTKSYVLSFTEALHYELRATNISVSALCPGPTATGFEKAASMKDSKLFKSGVMEAKQVAEIGYKGLMRNKMTIVAGFKNKVLALLSNITPSRNLLVWVSGHLS